MADRKSYFVRRSPLKDFSPLYLEQVWMKGKYYFYTQNSGKDTVKSPMGMFPAYAIDNDLN